MKYENTPIHTMDMVKAIGYQFSHRDFRTSGMVSHSR